MRPRLTSPSTAKPKTEPLPRAVPRRETIQPTVARRFKPDALDVDQLAEALRLLLKEPDQMYPRGRQSSDLLSSRNRVTHVMEARSTP